MQTDQKIDWTKPVQTRDGRPARVVCTDAKGEYPIVALIEDGNSERVERFLADGREFTGTGPYASDLVNAPERITYYVNWYAPTISNAVIGKSREAADDLKTLAKRVAVLHVITEGGMPVDVKIEHLQPSKEHRHAD